jgi:CheY-like chemotaxis protein
VGVVRAKEIMSAEELRPTPGSSVLLVDDDASLRKVSQTNLAASGLVVEEARSGNEALALIHERRFDLIVLNIDMPGLSGLEVCRQMHCHAPDHHSDGARCGE